MGGAGLALLLLLLAGAPALADDDDDGGGPGGGAAGAAPGGPGADPGADPGGGADPGRGRPLGAPGTGDPRRDLRNFLESLTPGRAPPPAPAQAQRPAPAAGATAVPNEITLIGLDAPARARLLAAGFTVIEERPAGLLPGDLVRMAPPRGLSAAAARDRARSLAPAARVDLNHLYRPGGTVQTALAIPVSGQGAHCAARPVGMIDTRVDPANPVLAGLPIERAERRGAGRAPSGAAHGTAVAALLGGALPGTPILAVDAFHRRSDGDAADAFDVAGALALLAERGIAVANLSFAGPANEVLALATERAAAAGMLLTAAAGNDGPQAPPRYPAAYPWVVAVTAVDQARRPFVRAGRGNHVDFAAPGVGLPAPGREGARLSGTSYAVPFVTAAFAIAMADLDRDAALRRLAASATDLGAPGRDPVFGWGLIGPEAGCTGRQAAR